MTLAALLRETRQAGRKVLAPYLCAGYPTPEATPLLLRALADAGADCIELGIPFSDPLADGGVIQEASAEALKQGMTLVRALALAADFAAQRSTPLVIMSYFNPLLRLGPRRFADLAREAGVAACIVPDLLPEAQGLLSDWGAPPLVQFAAPNTPQNRLREIAALDPPFLYCVSVLGVTGARGGVADSTLAFLDRVKAATDVPALVGFGVSGPIQAATLAARADGVIVGSALIRALAGGRGVEEWQEAAKGFILPIRRALYGPA